jgi:hypothetical protein
MMIRVTCCENCPFLYDYINCLAIHWDLIGEDLTQRPEWCPLPVTVEVKK